MHILSDIRFAGKDCERRCENVLWEDFCDHVL